MKISIIGGGSIGLLFAHYLKKQHEVCVYVRTKSQAQKLQSEGITLEIDKKLHKENVAAATFDEWDALEDLTIIAVKQYNLPMILKKIQEVPSHIEKSFLFVQNGMGHLKWLKELKAANVFVGIVEHGALRVKSNFVIHKGFGTVKIALFSGDLAVLENMINPPIENFPFIIKDNYEDMLLQKLMVNSVINPLTAILNVENGKLLENPHYFQLFKNLFDEVSLVLGFSDKNNAFQHLINVCKSTGPNRSSMLRDMEENRPTEIEAILGFVLEEAQQKMINAPLTESLFHMVKGKEYIKEGK